MIRVQHVTLPPGLSAFARRGPAGEIEVFVSAELEPARARSAVRLALRSFRSAGPRGVLLPVTTGVLIAAVAARLRSLARVLRAHAAVSSGVAAAMTVTVVAAVLVTLPHHHAPAIAGQGPAAGGQVHASAGSLGPRPVTRHETHGAPPSRGATHPKPAIPTSQRSSSPAGAQPATSPPSALPTPQPSSAAPQPTASGSTAPAPAPSPSPSAGGGGGSGGGSSCLVLLGIWICL